MNTATPPGLPEAVEGLANKIKEAFRSWANAPEHVERMGMREEIAVGDVDPFHWLQSQSASEKLLWSSRDHDEVCAGTGCCHLLAGDSVAFPARLFSEGRKVLAAFGGRRPRYFGGFAFSETSVDEAPWPRFGLSRFAIPRFELQRRNRNTFLACNLYFQRNVHLSADTILDELHSLNLRAPSPGRLPPIVGRDDFPNRDGWEANVLAALDLIGAGILDKVVLARKAVYRFASPVEAAHILAVLRPVTNTCYHFLFQPDANAAFMGTTPECLYRREGGELRTEALAGTRPRDENREKDEALANELLRNPKERHEQELVRRDLLRQLHLLSASVSADETPELLRLERKQHLISRIRATLRPGTGDAEVLKSLHPTPAVGGSPRVNALKEIPRLEPFSRGWYAAPVGWFGDDAAEFAVAIRSGLVRGDKVNVYSGAGIVQGSDPVAEWQEIENKISDFVKVTSTAQPS